MKNFLIITAVAGILIGVYLYSSKKKHLAQLANEAAAKDASLAAKKAFDDAQAKRKKDAEQAAALKAQQQASDTCIKATGLSSDACAIWIAEKAYAKSLANSGMWGSPNPRAGANNAPRFIWHPWDSFQKLSLADGIQNSDAKAKEIIQQAQSAGRRVGAQIYENAALTLKGATQLDIQKGTVAFQ